MKIVLALLLFASVALGIPTSAQTPNPGPPTRTTNPMAQAAAAQQPVEIEAHLTPEQIQSMQQAISGVQQANQFLELIELRIDTANGLGNSRYNPNDGKWYQLPGAVPPPTATPATPTTPAVVAPPLPTAPPAKHPKSKQ